MNQSDLIDAVAEQCGLSKADVKKVLHAQAEVVKTELGAGNNITLVDLGSFSVSHRAARTGRHPRTGVDIQIAAKKTPNFKASKGLKEATNTTD